VICRGPWVGAGLPGLVTCLAVILLAASLLEGCRRSEPADEDAGSAADRKDARPANGLPGYQGSESCKGCHSVQYAEWKDSLHARTVHEPSASEKQLLGRSLLCGDEDAKYVLGERHARRFMVASMTDPAKHLMLPCRYDVGPAEWVSLHETDWKSSTWEAGCGACHSVGFSSDDLTLRELGVGCEACHGPGSRHEDRTGRGGMVAFGRLTSRQEIVICASCHLQGGRSKATGLNFARNYVAGDDLFADYLFDWGTLDGAAGSAGNPIDIHQKLLIRDAATRQAGELRCTSCHEFHRMGHAKHEKLSRQDFCHLCHEQADFKLKDYNQSCNVCEF
jgi:nitrate/TMAO reductase-like tetraheme cytochrome c subunit